MGRHLSAATWTSYQFWRWYSWWLKYFYITLFTESLHAWSNLFCRRWQRGAQRGRQWLSTAHHDHWAWQKTETAMSTLPLTTREWVFTKGRRREKQGGVSEEEFKRYSSLAWPSRGRTGRHGWLKLLSFPNIVIWPIPNFIRQVTGHTGWRIDLHCYSKLSKFVLLHP